MSTTDNPVPLPFVTELPPVTMATNNDSPTLPESTSSHQPTLDPPIKMPSADGQAEPEMKETASSKDAASGKGVSLISGDTVDNPVSPKTSISPRQYHYERKDEKEIQFYITKAHTCVRLGHPTTSTDKDNDLTKFSEMVSQMTHLLAAAGIGRETATRALAYMAGPEKPEPKHALWEAKKDRRRKKNARRDVSGGSNKTDEARDGSQDKRNADIDKDAVNTSESSNPSNTLDNATTVSDKSANRRNEIATRSTAVPIMNATNQAEKVATTNGEGNGKKSVSRRRWWHRRNRRRSNQHGKGTENGNQKENANGGEEETEAINDADTKGETNSKDKETTTTTPLGSSTNAAATAA